MQPPVTALEIQMLRVYYNALDDDRKRQLLDYSQQLVEEQDAEKSAQATP